MNVLVTGGAGFIGHHLCAELARRGHSVSAFDNLRRGSFERPGLDATTCIGGDIRDVEALTAAMQGNDAVVHLAAQANVMGSQSDPDYTYATNVTGTWNVARAAIASGVAHVVFASSREVYGEPPSLPVDEATPFAPKNLYGASKAAGELLLESSRTPDFEVSILRLANVIGPGDSGRVVPLWLDAAASGQPLTVFGGDQVLDFVPMPVVVEAFVRCVERGPFGRPINIGSGVQTPLLGLAERVQALFPGTVIDRQPARPVEVLRFQASTGRMRTMLGLEPPADPLAYLAECRATA